MKNVIAMAGRGQRFVDAGYPVPKPFIEVDGHPLVWWAVRSLPVVPPHDLIFVVRVDHVREYEIDARLRKLFSRDIVIVQQNGPAQGQAHSVLLAREEIDNDSPLIIYNCDTFAPGVGSLLQEAAEQHPETDGFIPVFCSQAPNLSYVRTDGGEVVKEVAEKRVISAYATIGLYHYREGRTSSGRPTG